MAIYAYFLLTECGLINIDGEEILRINRYTILNSCDLAKNTKIYMERIHFTEVKESRRKCELKKEKTNHNRFQYFT